MPWDPDDFNGAERQKTWAPQIPPRMRKAVKKPLLGGGSFKSRSADADAEGDTAVTMEEVSAAKNETSPGKRSRIHTDPTHKRDIVVKGITAFGWGRR